MTHFQYGSYAHPDGEVNLTRMNIRYRHSPRGKRLSRIIELHLMGEICADTQSAITTRVNELIQAYQYDYLDAGLYLDDGTLSPHGLTNGDSLTGVRVIQRSWPKGGPSEYATARTFSVTLMAEYPDAEDGLVSWKESLRYIGNTGPRYEIIETYNGPVPQLTALSTAQHIIQSGTAVGYNGTVLPPGPLFPSIEHVDRRVVELGSGENQGQVALYYPTSWTYHFTSAISQAALPLTR